MSLPLKMVGGGGGGFKATDAILRVQALAGSTVTISKGGVSKTDLGHENADDPTMNDYYFIIHASQFDSNPWTVTSTLTGYDTATETIVINAADEYDITIVYRYWFVKNGVLQGDPMITEGKRKTSAGGARLTPLTVSYESAYVQAGYNEKSDTTGDAGIAYFPESVDMSLYNKFHIDGMTRNNTGAAGNNTLYMWSAIGTYASDNALVSQFAKSTASASETSYVDMDYDFDISEITSFGYVGVYSTKNNNGWASIRLVNVYVER